MSAAPDGDLRAELERVAEELSDRGKSRADLAARFEWLVNLLVQRGQLSPGDRRILDKLRGARSPVKLSLIQDKRAIRGPDVDCAALVSLCHARCCSFSITLSAQDLAERQLTWNLDEPYVMARDERTGYCLHCGEHGDCSAYEHRPAPCRLYDCREDPRVWIDFTRRIPAPLPAPGAVPSAP